MTIKYHTKGQRSIFGKYLGKCQNSGRPVLLLTKGEGTSMFKQGYGIF